MVRPWHKWLIVWGYDINGPAPDLTEEFALSIVRELVGDDSVKVSITSSSAWTVNHLWAESYSSGRVFCAGDAVHRSASRSSTGPTRASVTPPGSSTPSACSTPRTRR
jgi:2,4-dichlorophenol 6-monooxygenase